LKDAIGHDPEFGDFTAENLAAVFRSMHGRGKARKHVTNTLSMLKRLWQWCALKGYAAEPPLHCQPPGKPGNPAGHVWNPVNGEALKVNDAPGTLWHTCQREYFPKQIRINADTTRTHYRYAVRELSELLGRDPVIADLTDDNLAGIVQQMRRKGRAPETINGVTGKLRSLWTWLAKRRIVEQFPTLANVKEPRRVPKAWTRAELVALLTACRRCRNAEWWVSLHLVIWDTSERIGAVLAIRRDWLNWQTGDLLIPAEYRKGQEQDMAYRLHPETVATLRNVRDDGSDLLFPRKCCTATIYDRYKKIRKAAGLATDRKSAFHRMRRSVASHFRQAPPSVYVRRLPPVQRL
jgi:integrase